MAVVLNRAAVAERARAPAAAWPVNARAYRDAAPRGPAAEGRSPGLGFDPVSDLVVDAAVNAAVNAVPQQFVWQSRYGVMLIEVIGENVFVNGDKVERAPPDALPEAAPTKPRTPASGSAPRR